MKEPHLRWNHIGPAHGLMSGLSESLKDMESRGILSLPDLRTGAVMLVASDYGGEHNTAKYESLSFLFANLEECGDWNQRREELRSEFLPDSRRMSYKNLNDNKRKDALFPFLLAANHIHGLSVTFLINKCINSLFINQGKLQVPELSHWSRASVEKLLRVLHFISMFIEGLSAPNQHLFWFSDQDNIVPNAEKLTEVNNLLAHISSHYLTHDMGELRCGTTECDDGSRLIEDFVSVPDLIAGALTDVLNTNSELQTDPTVVGRVRSLENLSLKTRMILAWFKDSSQPLKRIVCVFDPSTDGSRIKTRWLQFLGRRDLGSQEAAGTSKA
jgi:hypothetical protein